MASPLRLEPTEDTVHRLKEAIEGALYKEGVELEIPIEYTGVTGFYDHNIKLNKIAYRAIEEFDLPLVRTWYKYGQFEPYAQLRPKVMEVGPQHNTEKYVYSGKKRTVTQGDVINFLVKQDLKGIFEDQDTFEFLIYNYDDLAPAEYKQTYYASTRIIEILEDLAAIESPSELNENIGSYRSEFKQASIDMRYELERNSAFDEEVRDHVENYLLLFEDALVAFEDCSDADPSMVDDIKSSRQIYHEHVLPLIGLSISVKEVEGPDEDTEYYSEKGSDILKDKKKSANYQSRGWRETLEEIGLAPSIEAYRRVQSGEPGALDDLSNAAIDLDERL